ncbi:MAG TPA: LON peptidase substrate-binding domain-containing protein [Ktedonobacterales bacterium]
MSDAEPGDMEARIPIFPLETVLFPGMVLPLSVCEPHEREMIARCLDTNMPAGILLRYPEGTQQAGTLARVGCLARIRDYERHPSGRHTVLISGEDRFVVLDPYNAPCCDMARVRVLHDTDDTTQEIPIVATARGLLGSYLAQVLDLVGGTHDEVKVTEAPRELSYLIGMSLCCDEDARQHLLEVDAVSERLRLGCDLLRDELSTLAEEPAEARDHRTW